MWRATLAALSREWCNLFRLKRWMPVEGISIRLRVAENTDGPKAISISRRIGENVRMPEGISISRRVGEDIQASTFTANCRQMAVHTGWHDAASHAHSVPCRAVEHQQMGVPGRHVAVVPWHDAGVCVMYATLSGGVCHVLSGSNHHMTAD